MAKKSENHDSNRAASSKRRHTQKQDRDEGSDNISGYRKRFMKIRRPKANKSKNGCFPKVFMLLLPFTAVGAYLFSGFRTPIGENR